MSVFRPYGGGKNYGFVSVLSSLIKLKQIDGSIKYTINNGQSYNAINPNSWPIMFVNSTGANLTIEFESDLDFTSSLQYFIVGQNNTTYDGKNYLIKLNGIINFSGAFENGGFSGTILSGDYSASDNVTIKNIGVVVMNGYDGPYLSPDAGYICRKGFGRGKIDKKILNVTVSNCFSNGLIDGNGSGGIIGSHAGCFNGLVNIINCYSVGNFDEYIHHAGGIIGDYAGYYGGTVNVSNCFSLASVKLLMAQQQGTIGVGCIFGQYIGLTGTINEYNNLNVKVSNTYGDAVVTASNCHFNGDVGRIKSKYNNTDGNLVYTNCYGYYNNWKDSDASSVLLNNNTWFKVSDYPNSPWILNSFGKINFDKLNYQKPYIETMSSQFSPLNGGQIEIYGFYFIEVIKISVDNLEVTKNISVGTDNLGTPYSKISLTLPANSTGTYNLQVETNSGISNIVEIIYTNGITINNIEPQIGTTNGDESIVISGNSFIEISSVEFIYVKTDGTEHTQPVTTFSVDSESQITIKTPPALSIGPVGIKITSGTSSTIKQNAFTYNISNPIITSTDINFGTKNGGDEIKIYGTSFFNISYVKINNNNCLSFNVDSPLQITIVTPKGNTDTAIIQVGTTDGFEATNSEIFSYAGIPVIDSLFPSFGRLGVNNDNINFFGKNFFPPIEILVNGIYCESGRSSDGKKLTVYIPYNAGIPGPAKIKVTALGGESIEYDNLFLYINSPEIISVEPKVGPISGGTKIKILGNSFYKFNNFFMLKINENVISNYTIKDTQTIELITPPGTRGLADIYVETTVGYNTNPNIFTYYGPPKIKNFSPLVVPGPNKTTGIISDFTIGNQTFSTTTNSLPTVTSNSPGTISWTSTPVGIISIDSIGKTWRMLTNGKVTLIANLADTEEYTSATKSVTFTIGKSNAEISSFDDVVITYSTTPYFLTLPIVTLGVGNISYTADVGNVASFDSQTGKITMFKAGTITITATLVSTTNYNEVSKKIIVTIEKAQAVLTNFDNFNSSAKNNTVTYTPGYFIPGNLPKITTGTGFIQYFSSNETVAKIDGYTGTIQMLEAGSTTITSTLPESDKYLSDSKQAVLTIIKEKGTLTNFVPIPVQTYSPVSFFISKLSQTGDGIIEYSSSDTTIATIGQNCQVTTIKAGEVTLTAELKENSRYMGAIQHTKLTIIKAAGSLSKLSTLGKISYSSTPFTPNNLPKIQNTNGGYGSNGTITYTSSDTSIATITNLGEIQMLQAGITTITTTLSGSNQYLPTSQLTTLEIIKINLNYSWVNKITKNFSIEPYSLSNDEKVKIISENYDGQIEYFISDNTIATINSTNVTLQTLKAGKTNISIRLSGSKIYYDDYRIIELNITKYKDILTDGFDFTSFYKTYTTAKFNTRVPTKTGDGQIEYSSSDPNVATIEIDDEDSSNIKVNILKAGKVSFKAKLFATDNYTEYEILTPILTIGKANAYLTDVTYINDVTYGCDKFIPTRLPEITGDLKSDGTISYLSSNPNIASVNRSTCEITVKSTGTVTIRATLSETKSFLQTTKSISFTIYKTQSEISNFRLFEQVVYDNKKIYFPQHYPVIDIGDGSFIYSCSDNEIATVNPINCGITTLKAGTVTITATLKDTIHFIGTTITADLKIVKNEGKIFPIPANITYDYNPTPIKPKDFRITDGNGTLLFSIDDKSVATINETTGFITMLKAGEATITLILNETEQYTGMQRTSKLKVNITSRKITWRNFNQMNWGLTNEKPFSSMQQIIVLPVLPANHDEDEQFEYLSSNNSIATFSVNSDGTTGTLNVSKPGRFSITAVLLAVPDRYTKITTIAKIQINKIITKITEITLDKSFKISKNDTTDTNNIKYNQVSQDINIILTKPLIYTTTDNNIISISNIVVTDENGNNIKPTPPFSFRDLRNCKSNNNNQIITANAGEVSFSLNINTTDYFITNTQFSIIKFNVEKATLTSNWDTGKWTYKMFNTESRCWRDGALGNGYVQLPWPFNEEISDIRYHAHNSNKVEFDKFFDEDVNAQTQYGLVNYRSHMRVKVKDSPYPGFNTDFNFYADFPGNINYEKATATALCLKFG